MSALKDAFKLPCYNSLKTDAASRWRRANDRAGGVVIFNQNDVCGWMDKLRDPHLWHPGAIAVDAGGGQWISVGGDEGNGAQEWLPIRLHH